MAKFQLDTGKAKLARLELTGLNWYLKQIKVTGVVKVERRSKRLCDLQITYNSHSSFFKGCEIDAWFPLSCRDLWLGTKWAEHFEQATNDFVFVREQDVKTVWKDFHNVLAAAFAK